MRNDTVITLWIKGFDGRAGNLSSSNGNLYSYNLKTGYLQNGKAYIMNYRSGGHYISQTTSTHVGLALRNGAILIDAE